MLLSAGRRVACRASAGGEGVQGDRIREVMRRDEEHVASVAIGALETGDEGEELELRGEREGKAPKLMLSRASNAARRVERLTPAMAQIQACSEMGYAG